MKAQLVDPRSIDKKNVKTGDVFVQHTPFSIYHRVTYFSWAIRKVTKSEYNHTSEALWIEDKLYMVESLGGGITLREWDDRANTKIRKKVTHMRMRLFDKNFDSKAYVLKALRENHKKYDYLGIIRLFVLIAFGKWREKEQYKEERAWWCSEFNAWMKNLDGRNTYLPKDFIGNKLFYIVTHK